MATVDVLIEGYAESGDEADLVQPTISLVRDGDFVVLVDPGILKDRNDLIKALKGHGLGPDEIQNIFVTHQHIDHTRNIGMFEAAVVYDYASTYQGDAWGEHDGDGHLLTPNVTILHTPGHTAECASLAVQTDDGLCVLTHAWWFSDQTPVEDPLAEDQPELEKSRTKILEIADIVIPGHGAPFRIER